MFKMNVPGAEGMVCNFDITQEGAEKVTDTVFENPSKMPHFPRHLQAFYLIRNSFKNQQIYFLCHF